MKQDSGARRTRGDSGPAFMDQFRRLLGAPPRPAFEPEAFDAGEAVAARPGGSHQRSPVGAYDEIIGRLEDDTAAPVMFVFEAAHSNTLGRPATPVILEMLRRPLFAERAPILTFPADRLQTHKGIGEYNIICIGGPRANVVARTLMEYEFRQSEEKEDSYHRINRPCVPFPVLYIQNRHLISAAVGDDDLSDSLRQNIDAYFPNGLEVPYRDAGLRRSDRLAKEDLIAGLSRMSIGAVSQRRRMLVQDNGATFMPIEIPGAGDGEDGSWAVLDFVCITVMPNPYCARPEGQPQTRAILVSGCTTLGTACFMSAPVIAAIRDVLAETAGQEGIQISQVVLPVISLPAKLASERGCAVISKPGATEPIFGRRQETIHRPIAGNSSDQLNWVRYTRELRESLGGAGHFREHMVALNRLDADQTLRAMQHNPRSGLGSDDIYILGCYEEIKTFATQQGRALTFVHALHKSGRLKADTRLVVVGAGISGLAVAVGAAMVGVKVHLVEAKKEGEFLSHMSGAAHRFIHPHFYDWPFHRPIRHESDIPFFDWEAASASVVTRQILEAYQAKKQEVFERYGERRIIEYAHQKVSRIYTRQREHEVCFAASQNGDGPEEYIIGDIVVIAAGFPKERAVYAVGGPRRWGVVTPGPKGVQIGTPELKDVPELAPFILSDGYWVDDEQDFRRVKQGAVKGDARKYVIVSGQGDGALIDILRLCIVDFDHKTLIEALCFGARSPGMTGVAGSARQDKGREEIYEKMGRAMKRATSSDEFKQADTNREREKLIEEALADHPVRELFDLLAVKLDPDLRVINVTHDRSPFLNASATAHRLLVWALYLNRRVEFISGEVKCVTVQTPTDPDPSSKVLGTLDVSIERKTLVGREAQGAPQADRRERKDKMREVGNVVGLIFRHGIDTKKHLSGITFESESNNERTSNVEGADDEWLFQELTSIINLTSRPHPETIKFFRYGLRQFL